MSREEDNTNITAFINRSGIKLSFDVDEVVYVNFNWKISILNVITTLTCTFTVLLVNALVLLMLKMKENTLVDRMVLLDCFANISTIVVMFLAFPIRVWGNTYFCLLATFFRGFVVVLNRLIMDINIHFYYCYIVIFIFLIRIIPLTVVVYRVLMVCYVEFCYNRGEKVIRDCLCRYLKVFLSFALS